MDYKILKEKLEGCCVTVPTPFKDIFFVSIEMTPKIAFSSLHFMVGFWSFA